MTVPASAAPRRAWKAGWLLLGASFVFHSAMAAHAALGTPVEQAMLDDLAGKKTALLAEQGASVLVFARPGQPYSIAALKELAACRAPLEGKPLRWAVLVSDSAAAEAPALAADTAFAAPFLVDVGDAVYGGLGIALHPVVVIVGADRRLAAFEPYSTVNFCPVVVARVRQALGELSDEEVERVVQPPRSEEGGAASVARRYLSLAEALEGKQRYEKAADFAARAVAEEDGLAAGHAVLARTLAALGRCEESAAAAARARQLDPAALPGAPACSPVR